MQYSSEDSKVVNYVAERTNFASLRLLPDQ